MTVLIQSKEYSTWTLAQRYSVLGICKNIPFKHGSFNCVLSDTMLFACGDGSPNIIEYLYPIVRSIRLPIGFEYKISPGLFEGWEGGAHLFYEMH